MIDADALHEAEQQALGQLAQMDLAMAARLYALGLATDDPQEVLEFNRAYQRASRGVRQTIMLRTRLRRDHARALLANTRSPRPPPVSDPVERRVDGRILDLQEAASRIIAQAAPPDTPKAERLDALDRIDAWIDQEVEEHEDFGEQDLDEHVRILCRAFKLPEDLARRFRDLPPAPREDDDPGEAYSFPEPKRRDTG
jgi:hypothetical protein